MIEILLIQAMIFGVWRGECHRQVTQPNLCGKVSVVDKVTKCVGHPFEIKKD
jgi:hypothetical protein